MNPVIRWLARGIKATLLILILMAPLAGPPAAVSRGPLALLAPQTAWGQRANGDSAPLDWMADRRRDQFGKEFSYYLYPLGGSIPGMGSAAGGGASILNMFGTDADFTGFKLDGDFSASGYVLLDLHLLKERLVFDVGVYDFHVFPQSFHRGINSPLDDYLLPEVQGKYGLWQGTLTFSQRRLEFYIRELSGQMRLLGLVDKDGKAFPSIDTEWRDAYTHTFGATLDLTDDRLDPRTGFRVEVARKFPQISDSLASVYHVTDYNLSGYIPFRSWDTLALNLYQSDAQVTQEGVVDFATLQAQRGFGCALQPAPAQPACYAAEKAYLDEVTANNRYGIATSLGGTQRLRSFKNGRFYAAHSGFAGLEYRWNLTDEYTPFNIYVAKGVRTGVQVAFFAETGSVADLPSDLWKDSRSSVGAGLRLVLSGVVVRLDYATGKEGNEVVFFINYPFSLFSVDNPS